MKKISTIIVGLGKIGLGYDINKSKNYIETHYSSIKQNNLFKLVGAIEKNNFRRNYLKKKINIQIFKTIQELKKKNKININMFIVATPTRNHYETISQILKFYNPKIIFSEKPFCGKINEALKISKICKKRKIKIAVNYLRRVDNNILRIKELTKNRKNSVQVYYSKNILTNASHFIDMFVFFFGKVVSIKIIKKQKYEPSKFTLAFKKAIVNFHKTNNKQKHSNYFEITNNKFFIKRNIKNFLIKDNLKKKKKIFLNVNKKLMYENTNQIVNLFKGRKNLLSNDFDSIYVHKIMNNLMK